MCDYIEELNYPTFQNGSFSSNLQTSQDFHNIPIFNRSIIENSAIILKPYIKVVDNGIKENSNLPMFTFRNYEISLFLENSLQKIICYRRYRNFVKLDNKLRVKYPYYVIPHLPPKNKIILLGGSENEVYKSREKGLTYYLNFLFTDNRLNSTKEFIKFIDDIDFDEEFFENNKNRLDFVHYENYKNSMKNTVSKVFGYFFPINYPYFSQVKSDNNKQNLERIEKTLINFENLYNQLKKIFFELSKNLQSSYINNVELSKNFFFLKDVENESLMSNKNLLNNFNEKFKIVGEIHQKFANQIEDNIIEKINNILLLINGIQEGLTNFIKFQEKHSEVSQFLENTKKKWENSNVFDEFDSSNELIKYFKQNLLEDIPKFEGDFLSKTYQEIVFEIKNYLMLMSRQEKDILCKNLENSTTKIC